ncbi:MAG: maleylacetoacetate isomerase [Gammaproteobacteria bacterium]|nr:maleylacetoacetate isomerase [Gammaproteobacteria bacterium]MCP4980632.1 maleylacetoacetate isomerase [Gammaproteobacteria bacterium]
MKPVLHNFFRSSTSTRLRAALKLKGLDYVYKSYALKAGEAETPEYLRINPQGLVPSFELADGTTLTQSMAIIEWLDEIYPTPPLLPDDPIARAQLRSLAYMIAFEIHPLNNLRVLQYIEQHHGQDETGVAHWYAHWVHTTFAPLEQVLSTSPLTGRYCHGDEPGLADLCLYAQFWNNRRFDIDTSAYPTIERIFAALDELDAFHNASPLRQPDSTA